MNLCLGSTEMRKTSLQLWWTSLRPRSQCEIPAKATSKMLQLVPIIRIIWTQMQSRCRWTWCSSRCFYCNNSNKWWSWVVIREDSANWPNRCSSFRPCKWTYRSKWESAQVLRSRPKPMMIIVSLMKTCRTWLPKSIRLIATIKATQSTTKTKMLLLACKISDKTQATSSGNNNNKVVVIQAPTIQARASSALTNSKNTSRSKTRPRTRSWVAWGQISVVKLGRKLSRKSRRRDSTQSKWDYTLKPIRYPRKQNQPQSVNWLREKRHSSSLSIMCQSPNLVNQWQLVMRQEEDLKPIKTWKISRRRENLTFIQDSETQIRVASVTKWSK